MDPNKDYYASLGLKKGASSSDIKKSFRALALKYHPDKNSGKDAKAKFQDINEAYEVLSDDGKRAQYERERELILNPPKQRHHAYGGMFGGQMDDMMGAFMRQNAASMRSQVRSTLHKKLSVTVALVDIIQGADISFEYQVRESDGGTHMVRKTFRLPAGTQEGAKISFPREGDKAVVEGELVVGDLVVVIRYYPFLEGMTMDEKKNVHYRMDIPYYDVILGSSIEVPMVEGGSVKINVKKLTDPNVPLRLKGKGMPISPGGPRADMHVHLSPRFPKQEDPKEVALIEEVKKLKEAS